MRLRVTFQIERPTTIPLNYQYQLASAIYHFIETVDADYARFLHSEGYAPPEATEAGGGLRRRFKLFTFSLLWPARSTVQGHMLRLWPGPIEWFVASPVEPFLTNFASGLLASGALRIDRACLPIASAETLPPPEFTPTMRCKCLSPIVVGVGETSEGQHKTRYLRPKDPDWSERISQNLYGKYAALHGTAPADPSLTLRFDPAYLATHRGTKLMTFKNIQIPGAFCPFTLSGSIDLMRLAWDAGLGEKNSNGFGMMETVDSRNERHKGI